MVNSGMIGLCLFVGLRTCIRSRHRMTYPAFFLLPLGVLYMFILTLYKVKNQILSYRLVVGLKSAENLLKKISIGWFYDWLLLLLASVPATGSWWSSVLTLPLNHVLECRWCMCACGRDQHLLMMCWQRARLGHRPDIDKCGIKWVKCI